EPPGRPRRSGLHPRAPGPARGTCAAVSDPAGAAAARPLDGAARARLGHARGDRRDRRGARGLDGPRPGRRLVLHDVPHASGGSPLHPGLHDLALPHVRRRRRRRGTAGAHRVRRTRGDLARWPVHGRRGRVPGCVRLRDAAPDRRRLRRVGDAGRGTRAAREVSLMGWPHPIHPGETPVLSTHFGDPEARTHAGWVARGGYAALRQALAMTPEASVEEVKASGLRGRGGAGFPSGMQWSFRPKDDGKPHYRCCNADESEPGTFKDREILRWTPHALIEGCAIACLGIRAETCYIFVRGEYTEP